MNTNKLKQKLYWTGLTTLDGWLQCILLVSIIYLMVKIVICINHFSLDYKHNLSLIPIGQLTLNQFNDLFKIVFYSLIIFFIIPKDKK